MKNTRTITVYELLKATSLVLFAVAVAMLWNVTRRTTGLEMFINAGVSAVWAYLFTTFALAVVLDKQIMEGVRDYPTKRTLLAVAFMDVALWVPLAMHGFWVTALVLFVLRLTLTGACLRSLNSMVLSSLHYSASSVTLYDANEAPIPEEAYLFKRDDLLLIKQPEYFRGRVRVWVEFPNGEATEYFLDPATYGPTPDAVNVTDSMTPETIDTAELFDPLGVKRSLSNEWPGSRTLRHTATARIQGRLSD